MYIAINKFKVKSEHADDFEKVWKERQSFLSTVPGFMRFWLLKSEGTEGVEFLSHSQWLNAAAFEGWRKSEQMAKAHSGATKTRDMLLGPPEFKAYEIILDEVPGHRTDYRSVYIDRKVEANFVIEHEFQKNMNRLNTERGLPAINVGAFEGQLLMMWVKSIQAKVGVEVGTLGGYSASWLLQGMQPDSKLYTLELEAERADLVRQHYKGSPFEKNLEVLQGPALETLNSKLANLNNIDFVFIDADKRGYGDYVEWAKPRLRKGGLIILDNAYIWGGMNYWQENWPHPVQGSWDSFQKGAFEGMTRSWDLLSKDPAFSSLVVPTGEGLLVALKN